MTAAKRHDETAERIIKVEGLSFALASKVGKQEDLREARQLLKAAIVKALEDEWDAGAAATMANVA